MKKIFFGLFFTLSTSIVATPFFAFAAPALDSLPDEVKSKYNFIGGVNAVVTDGTTLYIGGSFSEVVAIDPSPGDPPIPFRSNLAAIDLATYELVTDFNPRPNYAVESIAIAGDGRLYIGGDFTCLGDWDEGLQVCGGDTRNYLAGVDTSDGSVLSAFSPEPDYTVLSLVLNSDDSVLYAGGNFYAGDAEFIAAYTTADRTATLFDAGIDDTVNALALSSDDTTLYATGYFTIVNDTFPQKHLAAFDADTGAVIPDFYASMDDLSETGYGQVLALSSDDTTLYVGGFFQEFSQMVGEGVPFDETTDEPLAVFPKVTTESGGGGGGVETVYAAIPDGSGGWYIGGSFTHVGGVARKGLAHINADGTLDAGWDAGIDVNVGVYTLELSPDGTILYAGGNFVDENEQYLAAYSATDGTITAFHPFPGAPVYDIEISADGETIYFGGQFGTVTESYTARYNVAAFDTTGVGTLLPFLPNACDQVKALQLTNDGSTLYMGGDFTCVNSQTTADVRNRIAAFSTAGAGTLVPGFNPNANGTVEDLLLAPGETTIYAGGAFTTIGGASRNQFAEITLADGTATALDAGIAGAPETVYTIALSSDESTIYIGGDSELTTIGGQPRQYFGEINATTGAVTDFYPAFNGNVYAIAVDSVGEEVYIGGSFTGMNRASIQHLLAVDTSDSSLVVAFNPEPGDAVRSLALSSDNALLYAGGDFLSVNSGTARSHLAAFDTADGDVTVFNPSGSPAVCDGETEVCLVYGMALLPDDAELYVASYDRYDTGAAPLLVFDAGAVEADVTPPVITLLGSTPVNLTVGDVYADAGATAEDDVDGDITGNIVTVNSVDTNTVGTYVVTYNVEDAAGNPATEVTRTVNVSAAGGGDDDGGGEGGGTSYRRDLNPLEQNRIQEIMSQLIVLLQELIQKLIEEQQN